MFHMGSLNDGGERRNSLRGELIGASLKWKRVGAATDPPKCPKNEGVKAPLARSRLRGAGKP